MSTGFPQGGDATPPRCVAGGLAHRPACPRVPSTAKRSLGHDSDPTYLGRSDHPVAQTNPPVVGRVRAPTVSPKEPETLLRPGSTGFPQGRDGTPSRSGRPQSRRRSQRPSSGSTGFPQGGDGTPFPARAHAVSPKEPETPRPGSTGFPQGGDATPTRRGSDLSHRTACPRVPSTTKRSLGLGPGPPRRI